MIDVFLDLDGTLVSRRSDYLLSSGAKAFLRVLDSIHDLRVSFFSGADGRRNMPLVKELVSEIPNLKRKYEQGDMVYSWHHLAYRHKKKRLTKLREDIDMEQTILIDDCGQYYSPKKERKNLLPVYSNFFYKTHLPESKVIKFRRQNNLVRALGVLLWAFELSRRHSCSVVAALTAVQWDDQGRYRDGATNAREFYNLGLEAMKRFEPELELKEFSDEVWSSVQRRALPLFRLPHDSLQIPEADLIPPREFLLQIPQKNPGIPMVQVHSVQMQEVDIEVVIDIELDQAVVRENVA